MRMRIREVREIKEDKKERNLPYFQNEEKPKISYEDAKKFWDLLFAGDIEEQ